MIASVIHYINLGRPEFKIEPRNTVVDQGGTVMMNCEAAGEPKPEITWKKRAVELSSHDRLTILPNNSLRYASRSCVHITNFCICFPLYH